MESFTYQTEPTEDTRQNHKPIDNRLHLDVDARQVEAWELAVMESPKVSDWMLVFARYLANGRGLVSPALPAKPLAELTADERKQITDSEAYKAISRMKLPTLRDIAKSFAEQAVSGF